jgi:hypothetical protein
VRERHYVRGVVWDEPAPADAAELLNESTYDLRRRNIVCRGAVRLAPAGRVAEAIVSAAVYFGLCLWFRGQARSALTFPQLGEAAGAVKLEFDFEFKIMSRQAEPRAVHSTKLRAILGSCCRS